MLRKGLIGSIVALVFLGNVAARDPFTPPANFGRNIQTPQPKKESKSETPPPFVVRLQTFDEHGNKAGRANAIFLDCKQGLLITNLHVLETGTRYEIFHEGAWRKVFTKSNWNALDRKVDLGIVKLAAPVPNCQAGTLSTDETYAGFSFLATGFALYEFFTGANYIPKWYDGPYQVTLVLLKHNAGWDTVFNGRWQLENLRNVIEHGIDLTPTEKIKFYNGYLAFIVWEENEKIVKSLSGSPVLDQNGKIAAILSAGDYKNGLGVPAHEVQTLLDKVRSLLGNPP